MNVIDITNSLDWYDGLPRPNWDTLASWIDVKHDSVERREAWNEVVRQWLGHLADAAPQYVWAEAQHAFVFGPNDAAFIHATLKATEAYRAEILGIMPGLAEFQTPGKLVVLVWSGRDDYYRYLSFFHPERGEFGQSAGMHIRDGYSHVVLQRLQGIPIDSPLVHELTHAAFVGGQLPQWVEEGITQYMEHHFGTRVPLWLEPEQANTHRRHWREFGLEPFWFGAGFHAAGEMQKLSYELAEILMRLLISDHQPKWFGWDRSAQRRFLEFLRTASTKDAGQRAAQAELGFGLETLATRFLGPGDWTPRTPIRDVPWSR